MKSKTVSRITPADICALLRPWQKRLGMSHWDIEVKIERDLNGALGDALVLNEDARWAQIAIARNCPPEQLEPTVVHELLEIAFARLCERALAGMSEPAYDRWCAEKERLIEHLTHILRARIPAE
ncbi:MAG: hypothetical protein V2G42_07130 [bacterium JZ-2024 1]